MKRLLIVEDNRDILEGLQILFKSSGYAVEGIADGSQAYETIENFRPDVVLLDMLLSGVNGLTICNSLKVAEETRHIPVIMLSAHPRGKQLARAAGADKYVAKPFEVEEVLEAVKKAR